MRTARRPLSVHVPIAARSSLLPVSATPAPAEPGLVTPAELSEGVELEVEVVRRAWRVVASVKRWTDEDVTVEDHEWSSWTLPFDDIKMRLATPRLRRKYRASLAKQRLGTARAQAQKTVDELDPIDKAAIDDVATPTTEIVDTPVGLYIWPKRRLPNASVMRDWKKAREALDELENTYDMYAVNLELTTGQYVPEEAVIDDLLRMADDGLLEEDELEKLQSWKKFWRQNQAAEAGYITKNGNVNPETSYRR
jgi:hypothetical protein